MHTKEPWCSNRNKQTGEMEVLSDFQRVALCVSPEAEADACRIAACVNACAGFNIHSLEAVEPGDLFAMHHAVARRCPDDALLVEAQAFSDLLKAAELALSRLQAMTMYGLPQQVDMHVKDMLRSAIAAAKGE